MKFQVLYLWRLDYVVWEDNLQLDCTFYGMYYLVQSCLESWVTQQRRCKSNLILTILLHGHNPKKNTNYSNSSSSLVTVAGKKRILVLCYIIRLGFRNTLRLLWLLHLHHGTTAFHFLLLQFIPFPFRYVNQDQYTEKRDRNEPGGWIIREDRILNHLPKEAVRLEK